jgi:uncharacterized protein YkwD
MSFGRAIGVAAAIAGSAVAVALLSRRRKVVEDDVQRYEECVFDEVNQARVEAGLEPLKRDDKLDDLGHYYADLMQQTGKFAHRIDGRTVGERMESFGIPFRRAAENLQQNDYDSCESGCKETVWGRGGWMKSKKGHREAMLDPDYERAGLGVRDDGRTWRVAMYFRRT